MSMTINTNVASLNGQRNLATSQNKLSNSLQRLSSGLRINSAKDDAAGLAISNRMSSQIRGMNQAARNANDGISLAQTAEGALQESTQILQRIRELAVQSANDTNTASDRTSMQAEVEQLTEELQRIAETTQFNGKNLLDGTLVDATFQVGANAGANQTLSFGINSAQTADLSAVGTTISGGTTATGTSVDGNALAADAISVNGTNVAASASGSASDIAAAINAAAGSTVATAQNVQALDFTTVNLDVNVDEVGSTGEVQPAVGDTAQTESAVVTFQDLAEGESYTVAGVTITATGGTASAADIAAAISNGSTQSTAAFSGPLSGWTTSGLDGASLTFTSTTENSNIEDLAVSAAGVAASDMLHTGPNVNITTSGDGDNQAVIEVTFTALLEGQTFTAAGRTITAGTGGATALQVGEAFATGADVGTAVVTGTLSGYTAAQGATNDIVNLTATANGEVTEFTVTGGGESVPTAISEGSGITTTQGSDGTGSGSAAYVEISGFSSDAIAAGVNKLDLSLDGVAIDDSGIEYGDINTLAGLVSALNGLEGIDVTEDSGTITITATDTSAVMTYGDDGALVDQSITGTYALSVDGGDTLDMTAATADGTVTAQEVADAINGVAGFTATLNSDGQVEVTKGDHSSFALDEAIQTDGSTNAAVAAGLAGVGTGGDAATLNGQVVLDSTADITLAENTSGALAGIGLDNVGNATTTIDQLDISTVAGSTTAISSVDAALQQINEMRGAMGAVQSRFESTINNLQSASENIAAARSRIVDADFAAETAELTKAQILQQAGTAMLAQANQLPQAVLALIQ
jgi:flagellin